MSQPLLSSRARKPSSRYTALDPPPWNLTGMSRPMAAEGTTSDGDHARQQNRCQDSRRETAEPVTRNHRLLPILRRGTEWPADVCRLLASPARGLATGD